MSTPYQAIRHRCDFCRRSYASKSGANRHESRCWQNPATASCPTCAHYSPPEWPGLGECAVGVGKYAHSNDPADEGRYEWECQCPEWKARA